MAKKTIWNDDYWLYVMQLYMRRPVGVKPLYSRPAVELSLELHVHPKQIMARQKQIESLRLKIKKEKQVKKQMELNAELKRLRKELDLI